MRAVVDWQPWTLVIGAWSFSLPLAPGRANSEQSARMSQLLKSSGAMSAATMTSRVLGLVREMVYARFMGDTWVAGAFTLAFMVPNLFRRLLGEGVLTAAFIPVFKEKEKPRATPRCGARPMP
jgi:Lipid II flippase MurJ